MAFTRRVASAWASRLRNPADYDGDVDKAYWNPSTRTIWVWRSSTGVGLAIDLSAVSAAGDVPVLRRWQ